MVGGIGLSVCLSCAVPRPNSRTEMLWKPKIGRMEAHHTVRVNHEPILRSKGQRPITAVAENVPYAIRGNYILLIIITV